MLRKIMSSERRSMLGDTDRLSGRESHEALTTLQITQPLTDNGERVPDGLVLLSGETFLGLRSNCSPYRLNAMATISVVPACWWNDAEGSRKASRKIMGGAVETIAPGGVTRDRVRVPLLGLTTLKALPFAGFTFPNVAGVGPLPPYLIGSAA